MQYDGTRLGRKGRTNCAIYAPGEREMMTPSNFIVDVSEADFEYEVLSYSQNIPVVVEFWATWCQPCKQLGPMLERLTEEAQGSFRLARVDVDANPNLALRYGVRSVPTVKAISQGQVVGEFAGLQPETRVRDFLARLAPPSEAAWPKRKPTACWQPSGPRPKPFTARWKSRTRTSPACCWAW
jgi:thioredoxin